MAEQSAKFQQAMAEQSAKHNETVQILELDRDKLQQSCCMRKTQRFYELVIFGVEKFHAVSTLCFFRI